MKEHYNLNRELQDELIGVTFEEYLKFKDENLNDAAKEILQFLDENILINNEYRALENRILYFWDTKENFSKEINNLNSLWEDFIGYIKNNNETRIFKDVTYFYLYLANFTKYIDITNNRDYVEYITEKDTQILSIIISKIRDLDLEFEDKLDFLLHYWEFKRNMYKYVFPFGSNELEMAFLKQFYNNNKLSFDIIQSAFPGQFIRFTDLTKWFYIHLPKIKDYDYYLFQRSMLLARISIFRNYEEQDLISDAIYEYHKFKRGNSFLKKLNDYFTGYGEKPFRIIKLFFILHFTFAILNLSPLVELSNITDKDLSCLEKLIKVIYFNNTTFLTIGYGDVYPLNSLSYCIVMIQQLVGFLTTGAFISLVLRKMFRF